MRLSSANFEAALRRKRQQRGEPSQPAKRARVSAEVAVAPAVPTTAREPEKKPPVAAAPKPVGAAVEEGEIPATTKPMVVVLDEEEVPAAAEVPEAGQAAIVEESPAAAAPVVASPPAAAAPGVESAPLIAEGGRAVVKKPRSRVEAAGRKGGEPESSPHQTTCPPTRHPTDGPQETVVRRAPVLTSMTDAGEAARLLHGLRTAGSDAELRGLSHSAVFDSVMVSTLQAANGTLILREAMASVSEALSKALARGEKYKKESGERAQSMARLQQEAQARERSLGNKLEEAEGAASAAAAKLNLALERLKAAEGRTEELTRQLRGAAEVARVAMEKTTAAEKAAAEASAEKAGAVACADEACARAGEAENRAWEAEARAKEAEARAEKAGAEAGQAEARAEKAEAGARQAVADYKASPQFMEEVVEAGLGAYVQGFEKCKEEVAKALKIDIASLDGVQPGGSEEEPAEGEAGAEEPGQEAGAGEPGPQET